MAWISNSNLRRFIQWVILPSSMAQQPNDGSGRAPVAIVRPTTSVTSGVAVTQKLVSAAVAFGNLLKGTYGPNGLDKDALQNQWRDSSN